jgi:hypothetical protein
MIIPFPKKKADLSLKPALKPMCAYPECSNRAEWLYNSPGFGNGPVIKPVCGKCRAEIIKLVPYCVGNFSPL